MAKLEQIAEGATTRHEPDKIHVPYGSQLPPGVSTNTPMDGTQDRNHAPSKTRGLYRHYEWRFDRARGDVIQIRKLCLMAEVDYEKHKGNLPVLVDDSPGSHKKAVERLLEGYEGWHAAEVAMWESCSIKWVRRHRALNGMDPDNGEPREVDARTARIIQLSRAGLKSRAIADEVGCHHTTVVRTLNANAA